MTRKQILAGEGFYTNGHWALIWRNQKGEYVTTAKGESPIGEEWEHVGGGELVDGEPRIEWC